MFLDLANSTPTSPLSASPPPLKRQRAKREGQRDEGKEGEGKRDRVNKGVGSTAVVTFNTSSCMQKYTRRACVVWRAANLASFGPRRK